MNLSTLLKRTTALAATATLGAAAYGAAGTGGTITELGNDTIHTFTSGTGTFTLEAPKIARILVVGGGGSGGNAQGGGGGGGQVVEEKALFIPAGSCTVTIGGGGVFDAWGGNSKPGSASSFVGGDLSFTAAGGGAGGSANKSDGGNGACGGGGATGDGDKFSKGGIGSVVTSIGQANGGNKVGGGGGASGEAGGSNNGKGGAGVYSDISGENLDYGSGGGGGGGAAGGLGAGEGGKNGPGKSASVNRGGGGGGGNAWSGGAGGNGGSGVVIIRYSSSDLSSLLEIKGSLVDVTGAVPSCGYHYDNEEGAAVTCTAPEYVSDADSTKRWYVCGWQLFSVADSGEETLVRDSQTSALPGETALRCNYVHNGYSRLVWQEELRDAIGFVNLTATAEGTTGFTVSADVSGLGYGEGDKSFRAKIIWGHGPDNLCYTNDIEGAVTDFCTVSGTVTDLVMPGAVHYAKLIATDDDGNVLAESAETVEVKPTDATDLLSPMGYTLLAYAASSGSQLLDTCVVPGTTTEMVMHYGYISLPAGVSNPYFFGQNGASGKHYYGYYGGWSSFNFSGVGFPNNTVYTGAVDSRVTVKTNGDVILDNLSTGASTTRNASLTADAEGNLFVFGINDGKAASRCGFRLYSLKLTQDGEMACWLWPVKRIADGKVGFYDFVAEEFRTNTLGGTEFTAGAEEYRKVHVRDIDPELVLTVTGTAEETTGFDPVYGEHTGIFAGSTFDCFAPAAITDNGRRVGCTGWILYTNSVENAGEWVEWKRGDGNVCRYTHPEGTGAKLEWQVGMEYLVEVSAVGNGKVSVDDGEAASTVSVWVGKDTAHTVTATADDGATFAYWMGDVAAADSISAAFEVTVGEPVAYEATFADGQVCYANGSGNASVAASWKDGKVPESGAFVVFGGTSSVTMTWDLKDVEPGRWVQLKGCTASVTIPTTFAEDDFPVLKIDGDVILDGGTWLQSANPSTAEEQVYRLNVEVKGDFQIGTDGVVTATGKGWATSKHNGTLRHGSVIAPSDYGYSSNVAAGGGAVKLVVGGGLTLDGTVEANGGTSYNNNPPASGGSVWLTAGRMSGSGRVSSNGGSSVAAENRGTGGRLALVLTDRDADFEDFTVKVTAYGGARSHGGTCYSDGFGTIYYQTGAESQGTGKVVIGANIPVDITNVGTFLPPTDGCSASELKNAVLEVGPNAIVKLAADLKVRDFTFTDAAGKIDLDGHILKMNGEWRDYSADKAKFLNAGEWIDGKKPGYANVRWKTAGLSVLIK